MAYKQLPMVEVRVADLRLDLENYRIPIRPDDEAAALKYLFASEGVVDQARDFLRSSYFDNEVPIVVRETGTYVVLEGNRRVSALKAIQDSKLVPEHAHEMDALLVRYATEVPNMPKKIRVLVAPSRDAARPHIARLHTGVSKKRWSRDQQATYYHSLLGPTVGVDDLKSLYPDVQVVRFLRMVAMRRFLDGVKYQDKSLRSYVRSDELTMSAFEYAYRPALIASAIGVVFDGHRIAPADKEPAKIAGALSQQQRFAVEYLMKGFREERFNTRSPEFKKDSPQMGALLAILLGQSTPDPAPEPDPDPVPDPNPGPGGPAPGPGAPTPQPGPTPPGPPPPQPNPRGPNDPDSKRGFTIGGLPVDQAPSNLQKRYLELRKVDVARTPAAASMLLRSVLEATIKFHFEGTPSQQSGELGKVFPTVVAAYGKDRGLKDSINTIHTGAATKPGSVKWFNAAAHNPHLEVSEAAARSAFSLVQPVLMRLLQKQ
jgi:hypothetical protein